MPTGMLTRHYGGTGLTQAATGEALADQTVAWVDEREFDVIAQVRRL